MNQISERMAKVLEFFVRLGLGFIALLLIIYLLNTGNPILPIGELSTVWGKASSGIVHTNSCLHVDKFILLSIMFISAVVFIGYIVILPLVIKSKSGKYTAMIILQILIFICAIARFV